MELVIVSLQSNYLVFSFRFFQSSVSCNLPSRMEHPKAWLAFIGPLPKTPPIDVKDPGYGAVDIREKRPADVRNIYTADIYDVPLAYEGNRCW